MMNESTASQQTAQDVSALPPTSPPPPPIGAHGLQGNDVDVVRITKNVLERSAK